MGFWALIVAIFVNLSLALVILTRATKASSTAYFGISAFFIAFWALGALMMLYGWSSEVVTAGLLLFVVAPMATSLYMVLFSKHFSGINSYRKYSSIITYVAALVVFAGLTLWQLSASQVIVEMNGLASNKFNFQYDWFWLYGAYFIAMFSLGYVYLLGGIRNSRGRIRQQRRLVFIGIFSTSFLALVTNIFLPIIGFTDLVWMGPAWTIFYVVTTCYAMMKHGLFDLRSALVLTFTYSLSLTALAILYYFIALTVSNLFVSESLSSNLGGINIVIMLALAFMFQPIRRFFDKLTNSIFYQDSYKLDEFFPALSKMLTSTNDLQTLLRKVAELVSQTLKASDVSFVVYTGEHRTEQIGVGKYGRISYKDMDWLDYQLSSAPSEPKVLSLLDDEEEALRRMMVSHRITIILPLVRQDTRMGYLFLGEHRRSGYSARDMRVVSTLADELVIAIQNALSVEEVKNLNSHLEQRISSATKELRVSNAQLQRLDEAKDEFISMASHQLRTPLTSIKGYLSMLIEGDVGEVTKEQKHLLSEAFISSERMVRLIGDFLNVSRLQTGKFVIDKHPVDLAMLVKREIDGLESNAKARGIKFTYKVPKNIPMLDLDESKIQQVIMNFSDNAIFYSKEGGSVIVELRRTPAFVEFKVIDKGIGVPESEQADLFGKFFRATNARLARPDGTGVGLFLAKKVISDHGGAVIFESTEGKGSTFGFRLPIDKLAVKPAPKVSTEPAAEAVAKPSPKPAKKPAPTKSARPASKATSKTAKAKSASPKSVSLKVKK